MSTPLFDQSWVELQLGRKLGSREEAVNAYLGKRDCSPHPLFFVEYVDARFGRPPAKRNPLLWYLNHTWARRKAPTHPLVDLDAILAAHPELDDPDIAPLAGWLEIATPETPIPAAPGAPTITLGRLVEVSRHAVKEWRKDNASRFAPRATDTPPVEPAIPTTSLSTSSDAPLVSIVMPLWNRATVVRQAIESVQEQTHQDWELIVVDDGSTDDSVAVVTGIARFDPRIRVIEAEHRGVSAARNSGLAAARGAYVAFLDTDNQWRRDFLRVMLGELESHPDWGMAHAALRATSDGRVYYRAYEGSHRDLLVGNHVDLNVLVARRHLVEAVGGFDESLRRGVDYDLVLKLAKTTDLHLVPYIGVDYTDDSAPDTGPRISTSESLAWLWVIASRHLVDWPGTAALQRRPEVTSIVLAAPPGARGTARWISQVAATGRETGRELEIVVVGVRLPRWQHVALTTLTAALPEARLVRLQVDRSLATAANVGFAATTGARVVLVAGAVDPDAGAALRLADGLGAAPGRQAVAQPLVVGPTGSILSAGAVFDPDTTRPQPFLHDHAVADADPLATIDLPAATGPVVALWGDQLAALGGLDPLCEHLAVTEISLRAHREGWGATTLRHDVRFVAKSPPAADDEQVLAAYEVLDQRYESAPPGSTEAWAAAGFEVSHHRYDILPGQTVTAATQPMLAPRAVLRPVRTPVATVTEWAPALRWAIDLASPVGPAGQGWGDTHYGEALAAALRRRGQHVAVDARETRHRASRDHDDVILVLRGLDRVTPRPGRVNLEWIISHPDLVTAEEVAGFDGVFAASHSWSDQVSAAWGVEVRPLLQATDPTLFHPGRAEPDTGADVLFVGNSRGVFRSSLRHAQSAGIDVTVHGAGWSSMLGAEAVASRLVDNRELGALYAAAGVVLNDHWEDMRATGFVSNRLMDAAASGARVASDEIPGLDLTALFGGLVQTWADAADLARIVRERDTLFPSGAARVAAATTVAAEHSFDARAEVLLDHAVRLARRQRG